MTEPRDELSSAELLSSTRGRVTAAALVVLALAVVAIAALRPDRQGVGTPTAGASATASASPSPAESPSPSPSPLPPAPVPPRLTAKTGARLLVVQGTQLTVLNVDTGQRAPVQADPLLTHHDRTDVITAGGQLVMVGDDQTGAGSGPYPAYVTTAGPGSRLRMLGQASYLLPSVHQDRAWLVSEVGSNDAEAGSTLTEVDVRGVVHQRVRFRHRFGVRPFAGGFLVDANATAAGDAGDQGTDLVDARGRRLHHYDGHPHLVSGNTAVLAQNDAPCSHDCPLLLLTAGAGIRERTVDMASVPQLIHLALTPDGSRLFSSPIAEGGDQPPSKVAELDLRTGGVRELTDAWSETFYGASFVFSTDGRWMFFSDVDAKHIDAYDLQARRAYRVPGAFAVITQLALLE